MTDAPAASFSGHRAETPLLWTLIALVTLETLVVHLFVWLKWPRAAVPITALSVITVGWLVYLVRSLKRCPHRIEGDILRLRLGPLRSLDVPIASIGRVRTGWEDGAAKLRGVARLTLIAAPNRLIELSSPIVRGKKRVAAAAICLDDPAAFDAAMAARGIAIV